MKYCLDTNVCIAILKGKPAFLKKNLADIKNDDICIPAIVRYELFYGAYKSATPDKTLIILEQFLLQFACLNFNDITAKVCGEIRAGLEKKGTPIGPNDLMIAATALSENLILVTHNTKEFSRIENLIFEDWEV